MKHQGEHASIAPRRRLVAAGAAIVMLISAFVLAPTATASPATTSGSAPAAVGEASPSGVGATAPQTPGGPLLAADLSQFQPGNLISDAKFFDKNTMSEAQIQAFIESKVPSCLAGYTCLKDWYDTSRTTTADAMCSAYSGGMRERASTIIYKVAQACGINPQVFLVMLEKEQSLITHTSPKTSRFTIAMGQGCPDTAACDTRYYGFFNQVHGAAWQLKRYANPPGTSQFFTWYAPGKTWNIRYHPTAACGSSPVFVENQATANLYYYTPYQPNAAALRAGYGVGDSCSAHGNRNFFHFFTDWFGSTRQPSISSVTTSTYVIALNAAGAVWGYPFWSGARWGSAVQLTTTAAGTKRVIPVGDFDGDGTRDLLGVDSSGAVSLYRGAPAGAVFGTAVPIGANWAGAALITAAGDVDGDKNPDVYTTDASGSLLLWRATGAGRFRAPVAVGHGWTMMNSLVGGADMTRDGVPDLLARDAGGGLHLYVGNGRGGFVRGSQIGQGWGGMTSLLSPGDFSGDGNPDLLARDAAGRLWYYWGTGTGRIAGGTQVGTGWAGFIDVAGPGPAATGRRALPSGAGDVDGDLARDVVAAAAGGVLTVYRGDGGGSWRGSLKTPIDVPAGSRIITLGDFDGDGPADLGRVNADGGFDLFSGRGDGTYASARRIGNGWASFTAIVGAVDFDGDRRVDVLARDAGGSMLLYRGDGTGGWLAGSSTVGVGWSGMTAIFAVSDFDGDGYADVMARGADGSLWLYPSTGSGSWNTPRQVGNGWGGFTALLGPGNFDSSGGADVIARTADGRLMLYRGNGAGGWISGTYIGQGWNGFSQLG